MVFLDTLAGSASLPQSIKQQRYGNPIMDNTDCNQTEQEDVENHLVPTLDSVAKLSLTAGEKEEEHGEGLQQVDGVVENSEGKFGLELLDLPPEIILRIFIHMDIRTTFKTVILTCKTFHEILTTEGIWKSIFALKWENIKLTKDFDYVDDWKDVYLTYDDVDSYWKRKDKWRLECKKMDGHFSSVDAMHVMPGGQFAVSGSRDRYAIVWDMQDFNANDNAAGEVTNAVMLSGHEGWVWAVSSEATKPNEVITGSWDQKLKTWDLNRNGANIETYKYHPAAILQAMCHEGLIFTGSFDKKVRIFDPRSNDVQELAHQKGPILSLTVEKNMIISGSEDKTIAIWDRRVMTKTVKSVYFGSRVLCLSLAHEQGFNYLQAGGTNGTLNVFDTTNQAFTLLESAQIWEKSNVLNLANFHGAMIACSSAGYFKAFTPDRGLKLLQMHHEHLSDISSVHASNDILATGGCDEKVAFWKFCRI